MAKYSIVRFHCSTGKGSIPTATIQIECPDGSLKTDAATDEGNGPVDATVNVIKRAFGGIAITLKDYSVRAVNPGSDSVGEVTVRVECDEREYIDSAIGPDIIVASAEAIVGAVSQHMAFEAMTKPELSRREAAEGKNARKWRGRGYEDL